VRRKMLSTIEVKSNMKLTARERGKIVARREGHNIFLNVGREWLSKLCSYAVLPSVGVAPTHPDNAAEYHRIRYIGFGIGGNRQIAPASLFTNPPLDAFSATFTQGDDDLTVYRLETPVPITTTVGAPPYDQQWLGQVVAPPTYPNVGHVRYSRLFTELELTFGSYALMPLSEIGLFTNAHRYDEEPTTSGSMVAYDTFNTLSKTNAIAIEIEWTLRF
jgi:hypothetical protein